jgi:class 3 adenylate cyclase
MSDPNSGQYDYLRKALLGRVEPTPPDPRESLVEALVKASSIPRIAPTPPKTGLQKAMEDAYLSTLPPVPAKVTSKSVPTPVTGGSLLAKITQAPPKPQVSLKTLVKIRPKYQIGRSSGKKTLTDTLTTNVQAMIGNELPVVKSRTVPTVASLPHKGGRAIDSAVLFVDVRDSTSITMRHRNDIAAVIYKTFLHSMVKIAKYQGNGHVRGFAGDRIMVIYDNQSDTITGADRAVESAVLMQSFVEQVLKPKLNTAYQHPIECGIGIDYGNILAVRDGIQGDENNASIWPGRATNVASKLSDKAKAGQILITPRVIRSMTKAYMTNFHIADWGTTIATTGSKTGAYRISPIGLRYDLR